MNLKLASKKRPRSKKKSVEFVPNLVIDKILKFFNDAKNTNEIFDAINDDPTFGKSKGAYGIRKSTAANILKEREKLSKSKVYRVKTNRQGPRSRNRYAKRYLLQFLFRYHKTKDRL